MLATTFAGIDISAKELVVCCQIDDGELTHHEFENTVVGHKKLIKLLTKRGRKGRVCMEATGIYHFDLAYNLSQSSKVEVSVVNPRVIKNYADAKLQRAKTDAVDAKLILDYLRRMHFELWTPPATTYLELRAISRRILQLNHHIVQEKNRRHCDEFNGQLSDLIGNDIEVNIRHTEKRIDLLKKKAMELISSNADLDAKFKLLNSVVGIAELSAIKLLSELLCLPADMQPQQWVAHAGLDPRPVESGSSINKPRRISRFGNKYLRTALFMPAWVAIQHEPHVKAFYNKLVAKGKLKMQAVVAVMRKLLRAIWGMFNTNTSWNGKLFYSGDLHEVNG